MTRMTTEACDTRPMGWSELEPGSARGSSQRQRERIRTGTGEASIGARAGSLQHCADADADLSTCTRVHYTMLARPPFFLLIDLLKLFSQCISIGNQQY